MNYFRNAVRPGTKPPGSAFWPLARVRLAVISPQAQDVSRLNGGCERCR